MTKIPQITMVEYIWLDGNTPTQKLRSKTRMLERKDGGLSLEDLPVWSFDGSSTLQAEGSDSDCMLKPVRLIPDPVRGPENYLALCEVYNSNMSPHASNTRATLRRVLEAGGKEHDPWFGFEQEYTFFQEGRPYAWPEKGVPEPQGPYYCGVGSDRAWGRPIVEEHARACIAAGIMIYGINAEVMPAQWEFQIGYRGLDSEKADALIVSDHLYLSRWLLERISEDYGVEVSYHPKPMKGDWNGAGCHTNFSTKKLRASETGSACIEKAIENLEKTHAKHIVCYGEGLEKRLTGLHETCHIGEFKSGNSDRGASIRIPMQVAKDGCGYIEDRRPAANCDPYTVCRLLVETVCEVKINSAEAILSPAVSAQEFRA